MSLESFCHNEFETIMEMDGLMPDDIISSLNTLENRFSVFKAGQSAGLSESFFFFSHDFKFLMKTILPDESRKLKSMLFSYIQHLQSTNNQSLLARIYGIYQIKSPYFAPLELIVMQNTA